MNYKDSLIPWESQVAVNAIDAVRAAMVGVHDVAITYYAGKNDEQGYVQFAEENHTKLIGSQLTIGALVHAIAYLLDLPIVEVC